MPPTSYFIKIIQEKELLTMWITPKGYPTVDISEALQTDIDTARKMTKNRDDLEIYDLSNVRPVNVILPTALSTTNPIK